PIVWCLLSGTLGRGMLPQFEPLNLAGCGFWQIAPKLDPARIFERRKFRFHMILKRTRQGVACLAWILQHDESLGLDEAVDVVPRDQGRVENLRMGLQRAFDFERGYIETRYLQHVVAPAAIDEIALLVLDILVA